MEIVPLHVLIEQRRKECKKFEQILHSRRISTIFMMNFVLSNSPLNNTLDTSRRIRDLKAIVYKCEGCGLSCEDGIGDLCNDCYNKKYFRVSSWNSW